MYFIFKLEYSQTDNKMVIIKSDNKQNAEKSAKILFPNARYINYYGCSDKIY